ncbi:MAG: class I SAM-dependent methyltransferase, partial [Longimicrobiales bacterium]
RELDRAMRTVEKAAQQTSKRQDQAVAALSDEIGSLRKEVHDRLLQYHLQLARLSESVNGGSTGQLGSRVPVRLEVANHAIASGDVARSSEASVSVLPDSDDWIEVSACPACRTAGRTIVCEWNKLVLLDTAPDEQATRYDYAVCHGCGILYATRRPVGTRYRYLVDNFEEVIDKDAKNPLLNPHPLTDVDRDRCRRLIARGVFVSDHEPGNSLSSVLRDRMENAGHVDLLGSLLNPRGARVLEVRPRAGTILEGLRRHYGADVHAMPMWESQQFIIEELYGIPTSTLIDFDCFRVPFEEPFDLIVCNHMFNHAVRLDGFLDAVRNALRPGGAPLPLQRD